VSYWRNRWGSFSAPPRSLAAIRGGVILLREREGEEGNDREGGESDSEGRVTGGGDCLLFI